LEKYGFQQIFSHVLQDLYLEPEKPQGHEDVLAFFAKKWRQFVPTHRDIQVVKVSMEEINEQVTYLYSSIR